MKRAILILIGYLIATIPHLCAQSEYLTEGDEAFEAGLYKQAYDLYLQAEATDASPALTYKLGEACRMYNGYSQAIKYYRQLSLSTSIASYPQSTFYLALMYKCDGKPDSALIYFRKYLDINPGDSTLEARCRQEIKSCQWILDSTQHPLQPFRYTVTQENRNVNTANSESGAIRFNDTLLMFSSVRELSRPGNRNVINTDLVLMQIYESAIGSDGQPKESALNSWGLNSKKAHSGNVAFDRRNKTVYFNLCSEDNSFNSIPCDIYYSRYADGKWSKPRPLGGSVNMTGYSSTQPTVGYLPDSTVILYFSSDRPRGMDIWYTIIKPDCSCVSPCINLGTPVNTPGNEITPFYDNEGKKLYFSSDWHYGYGAYDVFSSAGSRDSWQMPQNLGESLNSPANDIYFTINHPTPQQKAPSGYLTSNRSGSFYVSGNTCCNDIYRWELEKVDTPRPKPAPKIVPAIVARKQAATDLLPISLYFHNDEPDPKTDAVTTTATYYQTYNRYMFMRQEYKNAFDNIRDPHKRDSMMAAVDTFFTRDVYGNCQRFNTFMQLLIDDLAAGRHVTLTVEGYASPLHTGNYNFNLSKRRIASIINQMMTFNHGILTQYIGSHSKGSLQINEAAYGSSHAKEWVSADRGDAARSVYSVDAARERRIELVGYKYKDDTTDYSYLVFPSRTMHIGTYFAGEVSDVEIHLPHSAPQELPLDFISVGFPNVHVSSYSKLTPGNDLVIHLSMDNRNAEPAARAIIPLTLRVKGEQITQTIFLEYAIIK